MRIGMSAAVGVGVGAEPFQRQRISVFWLPILILLHSPCSLSGEMVTLSIGTYNLWNVMFNWKVRLQHAADKIRQNDLDVVVFQEVRLNCKAAPATTRTTQSCPSQLDEVRWLLPEYRWVLAYPAGTVTKMKLSMIDDWQFEGLGIISRRPILSSSAVRLRQTTFRDTNKRIALHIKVKVGQGDDDDGVVDILVVHFSYDPQQQCDNANDVVQLISGAGPKYSIVLGDFNAYDETSPAIGQFVNLANGQASCKKAPGDGRTVMGNFKDAWISGGRNHQQGLSFSNMPTPGLQSRPDRIIVSEHVKVTSVGLVGNESLYWDQYQRSVTLHRVMTVCKAAYHSFMRLDGYSCLHDCGPHGSCRCGVCVKGGNNNNCQLPNCSECSGIKFIIFISLFLLVVLLSFVFMLSVIRILVVSARFNQEDIMDILGYRCCLFNRQLFQIKFNVFPRRLKLRMMSIFRLCNLPPALAALVSFVLLCCTLIVIDFVFQDAVNVIVSVLPEEKFPSDHKMIFTRVKLL